MRPSRGEGAPVAGILLMCGAVACFAFLDATAKWLGQTMFALDIVWLRYAAHIILVALFLRIWEDRSAFDTRRPWLHTLRGAHLLGATLFNFWAIQHLQLAEASAIMFAAPLIVTALAGPVLGETIGLRRWVAVGVGFIGVLIVTRPGTAAMHWAVGLSVVSVINYSLYTLLTRKMNATENAHSLLLLPAFVGAGALAPFAPSALSALEGWQWALAGLMGVFGAVGHFMLVAAHGMAGAALLAPFVYTQMIWMIVLGLLLFGDVPDVWTLVGSAIIAASGLYVLHRERVRARLEPAVESGVTSAKQETDHADAAGRL
ncbi:MAG: DMT family transporter [Pseudomonadota bacterium]